MNTKYIIGNWKANKTIVEAEEWCKEFFSRDFSGIPEHYKIIICPPFQLLTTVKKYVEGNSKFLIGCQDVSSRPPGPYTGEIPGKILRGLVAYAIIGHSECRRQRRETRDDVNQKLKQCGDSGIEPILCISKKEELPENYTGIVAYEPKSAISSGDGRGETYSSEDVIAFKHSLSLNPDQPFLYGGSVHEENAGDYLNNPEIGGVLCGGVSLDAEKFYEVIKMSLSEVVDEVV